MDNHGIVTSVTRRSSLLTFSAIVLLVVYAPILGVIEQSPPGIFGYLADDAFYYLAVADHSTRASIYTFDGTHATNGFHPLWQWLLTFVFGAAQLSAEAQVLFVFAASIAGVAIGTGLFGLAVLRTTGSPPLALLASVPGFYWWLTAALHPGVGAQWTSVNGMESPLSLLFFGVLAWLLIERRWLEGPIGAARLLPLSLVLTLATLSRLDDVFLFAPFLGFLLLGARSRREGLARLAWASLVPLIAIGGYLLYNLHVTGAAFPVSGAAKSQGLVGGLLRNGYALLTTLLPVADVRDLPPVVWQAEAWRMLQMVVPTLGALLWILRLRPPRLSSLLREPASDTVLVLLAVYVVLKAGYNFACVGLWHQGHWYYPLSIAIFNWIVAAMLATSVDACVLERVLRPSVGGRELRLRPWLPVACVLAIVLAGNAFTLAKAQSGEHAPNFAMWQGRRALESALEARCPGCGILSFDDGIVAYSLSIPTLNGVGFALDREALAAKRGGQLLEIAHQRGCRLLVSLNYPVAADLDAGNLRERLSSYRHLAGEDLERWHFAIAYRDPASGAVFIRFDPAG